MKANLKMFAAVALTGLLFTGVAVANRWETVGHFLGGVKLGRLGTTIEDSFAASSAIDFAGVTDQCEDSSGITVTGAAVNDLCTVGAPASMPCTHCWVTCYVSAADTVKVRLCAHGASGNPASATYAVRVFDP